MFPDAVSQASSPLMAINDTVSHSSYLSAILSIGLGNPAFFNALLSSIAFAVSPAEVSTEALAYKGEAIRILNDELRDRGEAIDEVSIATIAGLANFEVRIWSPPAIRPPQRSICSLANSAALATVYPAKPI